MVRPQPPVPDPDAWCIHGVLPGDRALTSAELYARAFGVEPEHGAKPLPMFWDEADGAWWSLSPMSDKPVAALVWTVDLVQLGLHPEAERRPFLDGVVLALTERLAELGVTLRLEESAADALLRLPKVVERDELVRAPASVVVVPPEPASVRAWWQALVEAGMSLGDGDMFWIDAEALGFPEEYFEICAEPLSSQGYFHPGDLDGDTTFPDVTLSFPISAADRPRDVVPVLLDLAEKVAAPLGAKLQMPDGTPWSKARTMALIEKVQGALG